MTVKNEQGEMEQVTDWESYACGYAAAIADVRRPPDSEGLSWQAYILAYAAGFCIMMMLIRYFEGEGK